MIDFDLDTIRSQQRSAADVGVCGIYFLLAAGEIIYIGQSREVYSRIRRHKSDKAFDGYFVHECSESELYGLEAHYIAKFSPPINKSKPGGKRWEYIKVFGMNELYEMCACVVGRYDGFTSELADRLEVSPDTIERWAATGRTQAQGDGSRYQDFSNILADLQSVGLVNPVKRGFTNLKRDWKPSEVVDIQSG